MKYSWHNSCNYDAIITTPIYTVNITYFVRLIFVYNMAIYTITYKFTYVYETVRSLHIRVKIFKHGYKHETPAIPVPFKCSREKDVLYGKPFVIRTREWC